MAITRKRKQVSTNTSLDLLNNINERSPNKRDKKHEAIWDIPPDSPEHIYTSRRILRSRHRNQLSISQAVPPKQIISEAERDATPNTDNESVPLSQFLHHDFQSSGSEHGIKESLPDQKQSPPIIDLASDDDNNSGSQELEDIEPDHELSQGPPSITDQNSPEEDEIDDPFPERFTFFAETEQPAELVHDNLVSSAQASKDEPNTSKLSHFDRSHILQGAPSEITSESESESESSDFEEIRPLARDGFLQPSNKGTEFDVERSRSPPQNGVMTVISTISAKDSNLDVEYVRDDDDVEYARDFEGEEDEEYERAQSSSQGGKTKVIAAISQQGPNPDVEYVRVDDDVEYTREPEGDEEDEEYERVQSPYQGDGTTGISGISEEKYVRDEIGEVGDFEVEESPSEAESLLDPREVARHPASYPDSQSSEVSDIINAQNHFYLHENDKLMKWFTDMVDGTPWEKDGLALRECGLDFQYRISRPMPRYLKPAHEIFEALRKGYDKARLPTDQVDLIDSIFDEIKAVTDFPSSTVDDPKSAGEKVIEIEAYLVPLMVKQIIMSFRAYMTLGRPAYDQLHQSLQLLLSCSNRMDVLQSNGYFDIKKNTRYSWSLRNPLKNLLKAMDKHQTLGRAHHSVNEEEVWTPEQDKTLLKALRQFTDRDRYILIREKYKNILYRHTVASLRLRAQNFCKALECMDRELPDYLVNV